MVKASRTNPPWPLTGVTVPGTIVDLPRPRFSGGRSLATALRRRCTTREISAEPIEWQELSNVLWAARGQNRVSGPFGGPGLTAASASNSQEIDLYVALVDGLFAFDSERHALRLVRAIDARQSCLGPHQPNVAPDAPVQLVYVVDLHKLTDTRGFQEPGLHDPEIQKSYYFVDTGLIAGNVYLYAASRGLACWFHNCDKLRLSTELGLGVEQRVLFAQTIGHVG